RAFTGRPLAARRRFLYARGGHFSLPVLSRHMTFPAPSPAACRTRQQRLLARMQERNVELAIITSHAHVQWLAGPYYSSKFQPAAALRSNGHLTVVVPSRKPDPLLQETADEILTYDAQWHSTLRNDQRKASSEVLARAIANWTQKANVGVEFSTVGMHLSERLTRAAVDLEPDLFHLRRRKDADELAMLRHAIAATGKMYERARKIVRPGMNELDVFSELQAVAVRHFGEPTTDTGNDYAANARGGPPRDRNAQAGELYILDLGPAYRGYYSDTCRTLAVDRKPTAEQQAAWAAIVPVFDLIQSTVRPGVRCREIFERCQKLLDKAPHGKFDHHLGHGFGLFPHEAPHLNPYWDDTFEPGDTFTVEPGLYAPNLQAGIRLENDYLVTETGVQLLSDFHLEL
ncbi:MAG: Xaa-Pro peptidase family protein, partial [Pirellulales bacterium]